MKKKVLYGMFMALFAVVSMGSLQSCKDDLDGLRNETKTDITSLKTGLDKLEGRVETVKDSLAGVIQGINNTLTGATGDITDIKGRLGNLETNLRDYATLTDLQTEISNVKTYVDTEIADKLSGMLGGKDFDEAVNDLIDGKLETVNGAIDLINGDINTINNNIENINSALETINGSIGDVSDRVAILEGKFSTLSSDFDDLKAQVGQIQTTVEDLGKRVTNIEAQLADKADKVDIERLEGLIAGLDNDVLELWAAHRENQEAISALYFLLEDFQAEVAENFTNVFTSIDDIYTLLGGKVDKTELDNLFKTYLDANGYVTSDEVEKMITDKGYMTSAEFNKYKEDMQNEITAIYTEINDKFNKVNGDLTTFKTEVNNKFTELDETITNLLQADKDLEKRIAANEGDIQSLKDADVEINKAITGLSDRVTTVEKDILALQDQVKQHGLDIKALYDGQEDIWNTIYENQETMTQILNIHAADIEAVNARIDELFKKYDALNDRINNQITGIIVQGTFNSFFGTLNTPVGIQSNILFNWYGKMEGESFNFPTYDGTANYLKGVDPALTKADFDFLKPATYFVENGEYLSDGNLGRVYLTVNPVNVDFTGAHFNLETSAGRELPYSLDPIEPCTDELAFGYSRADKKTGFYSAEVNMTKAADLGKAIEATKIVIEPGLKSAVKDALKDRTKRSAVNLFKAVYSQIDGFLPAYGVRADFTESGVTKSFLSNYGLAITTVQPLSYSFYATEGELTSRRLSTRGHLDNLFDRLIGDLNDFHFDLSETKLELDVDGYKIKFGELTFNFDKVSADIDEPTIIVTIPEINVYDNDGNIIGTTEEKDVPVSTESVEELIANIEAGFNEAIASMSKELNEQINQQITQNIEEKVNETIKNMLNDIQGQVNDMLAKMEGEINGKIDELIADIKDKVNNLGSKFNRFIDIYNRFANQVNRVLAHPNNYLQPAMLYTHSGGVGVSVLSTRKSDPTPFANKGGNAITVYATSYSGELIAPAFKKFIAVSNVYDKNGNSVRDSKKSQIDAINKASELNRVLPGGQKRVAISTAQMEKDYTYEIVYQGLDYKGVTSTRKFYIKVK